MSSTSPSPNDRSRRVCRAVLLSVLALLAAACGSSGSASGSPSSAGSPSSSTAAPSASVSAALCSDVAALRGSLQELTSIRPSPSTATELTAAVQNVRTNLADLSTTAGALWNEQVGNLRSALTKLQSAVSTLAAQRNASSVSGVVTAVGGVSAAARQLLDAASPSCPSPSASPGSSAS